MLLTLPIHSKDPGYIAEAIQSCEKELRQSTSAKGLKEEGENGLLSGGPSPDPGQSNTDSGYEDEYGDDDGSDLSCDVGTQLIDEILGDLGISGAVGDTINDIGDWLPICSSLKASLHCMLHSGFTATYASAVWRFSDTIAKSAFCHLRLTCYRRSYRSHAKFCLVIS